MTSQQEWWLAEVKEGHGSNLVDGAHDTREGAEEALTIFNKLGFSKGKKYKIAQVILSDPTGEHQPVNEDAIKTLNDIGLKP